MKPFRHERASDAATAIAIIEDGRLTAIAHDVVEQTSTVHEFAEQTAVTTRMMYAAPNRRTTHRLARLDVPTPSIMRAPGECPGMFALESAMDEMALACGLDPIEYRIRNEPPIDPDTGHPFSSRGLVACLRQGARRFRWQPYGRRQGMRIGIRIRDLPIVFVILRRNDEGSASCEQPRSRGSFGFAQDDTKL